LTWGFKNKMQTTPNGLTFHQQSDFYIKQSKRS